MVTAAAQVTFVARAPFSAGGFPNAVGAAKKKKKENEKTSERQGRKISAEQVSNKGPASRIYNKHGSVRTHLMLKMGKRPE